MAEKLLDFEQSLTVASHARILNARRAENRLWVPESLGSAASAGRSMALTWRCCTCRRPANCTVTCLPATGDPREAQFVASVSSISLSRLTPSPLAVAPLAFD